MCVQDQTLFSYRSGIASINNWVFYLFTQKNSYCIPVIGDVLFHVILPEWWSMSRIVPYKK